MQISLQRMTHNINEACTHGYHETAVAERACMLNLPVLHHVHVTSHPPLNIMELENRICIQFGVLLRLNQVKRCPARQTRHSGNLI